MRAITKKHIDTALKIIGNQKVTVEDKFEFQRDKRLRRLAELEYVERLIKALHEDIEIYKRQPKIL